MSGVKSMAYRFGGWRKRLGADRVEAVCAIALAAGMFEIRRLQRMLELAAPPVPATGTARVIPIGRFLRPAKQYALEFHPEAHPEGEPRP